MTFNPPPAPAAPSTSRPGDFAQEADVFVAWMAAFGAAINAVGGLATGDDLDDLDAATLAGIAAASFLRGDQDGKIVGRLDLSKASEDLLRIGYRTGGNRDVYLSLYDGLENRRGYIQARGDRLRIHREGGVLMDLFGDGDVRINGARVIHESNGAAYFSQLGIGQTPQSVPRSAGTTYRNTTGKAIFVGVMTGGSGEATHQVSVNGTDWRHLGYATGNGILRSVSYVVPDGHYYRISTGSGVTIHYWMETR